MSNLGKRLYSYCINGSKLCLPGDTEGSESHRDCVLGIIQETEYKEEEGKLCYTIWTLTNGNKYHIVM
jgi:hypothetical protein